MGLSEESKSRVRLAALSCIQRMKQQNFNADEVRAVLKVIEAMVQHQEDKHKGQTNAN